MPNLSPSGMISRSNAVGRRSPIELLRKQQKLGLVQRPLQEAESLQLINLYDERGSSATGQAWEPFTGASLLSLHELACFLSELLVWWEDKSFPRRIHLTAERDRRRQFRLDHGSGIFY